MIDNQKVHKGGSNIPTTTPLTLAAQFAIFSQSLEGFFCMSRVKAINLKENTQFKIFISQLRIYQI